MEENNTTPVDIPFFVAEAHVARLVDQHDKERAALVEQHDKAIKGYKDTIKKLWITILALLVVCAGLFWYSMQFETVVTESYTSETDGGGTAVVNRDGSVTYGESNLHENESPSP